MCQSASWARALQPHQGWTNRPIARSQNGGTACRRVRRVANSAGRGGGGSARVSAGPLTGRLGSTAGILSHGGVGGGLPPQRQVRFAPVLAHLRAARDASATASLPSRRPQQIHDHELVRRRAGAVRQAPLLGRAGPQLGWGLMPPPPPLPLHFPSSALPPLSTLSCLLLFLFGRQERGSRNWEVNHRLPFVVPLPFVFLSLWRGGAAGIARRRGRHRRVPATERHGVLAAGGTLSSQCRHFVPRHWRRPGPRTDGW